MSKNSTLWITNQENPALFDDNDWAELNDQWAEDSIPVFWLGLFLPSDIHLISGRDCSDVEEDCDIEEWVLQA
jgi:hypothetical protein